MNFATPIHFPAVLKASYSPELRDFYLAFFVRAFATALIVIFEPIYVFLLFDKSISAALAYFAVTSLLLGLFAPLGAKVVARFGEKHAMLSAAPFLFLYYLVLWQIQALPAVLVPLAVLLRASHDVLFWPAFHLAFLRISNHGQRGQEYSLVMFFSSAAMVVGPLIGGAILSIEYLGWPVLFSSVLVMLFLSGLILLRTKDVRDHIGESYGKTWSLIFSKQFLRQALAFVASGGESGIVMYVWPIFLFTIAFSFQAIGLLGFSAALVGLLVIISIGRITDKIGHRKVLSLATRWLALVWLLKMLTRSHPLLFILHTVAKLFGSAAIIPFMAIMYEHATEDRWRKAWFIVFREVAVNCGRAVILFALAIFFLFVDGLQWSFIFAAIFSLLLNVI